MNLCSSPFPNSTAKNKFSTNIEKNVGDCKLIVSTKYLLLIDILYYSETSFKRGIFDIVYRKLLRVRPIKIVFFLYLKTPISIPKPKPIP